MTCLWEPLFKVLPPSVGKLMQPMKQDRLQEVRLREGHPIEWVLSNGYFYSEYIVKKEDLRYIVSAASRYSPWTAETVSQGYLTIEGGHRIGLCGEAICQKNGIKGFREVESICIRLARDIHGIAGSFLNWTGSLLIIGAPGWGKSTMLRELSRQAAREHTTVVIDDRGELFPPGFRRGQRMDVLSMCPKKEGIDMALRTMCPEIIAVDEITAEEDCRMILRAANCGVSLLATAHAATPDDLHTRDVYRVLLDNKVFSNILHLHKDKSGVLERVNT